VKLIRESASVAIVGLGYVGLPLALTFGKQFRTVGLDLSAEKIDAHKKNVDPGDELTATEFQSATKLEFTSDPARLADAQSIVVAVPTSVDDVHKPDLGPLVLASEIVGKHMAHGMTVIYESTVYPGATEEICVPVLEKQSGPKWRKDFHVGYSPERINPGDAEHTLARITKVVAADDEATSETLEALYGAIIDAGVHRAPSIKVAEAAKVIENTQRDLNIALMNELSIIFERLEINTHDVLEAAGTKWNFLPFRPGLVGGHCIGVDPYYLTHKAEMVGYHPQVILAGRRINDGMGRFVAQKTIELMISSGKSINRATVNVFGLTFKEDVSDLRNSRVPELVDELRSFGVQVFVHDPCVSREDAMTEYDLALHQWDDLPVADAVILAVPHKYYRDGGGERGIRLSGGQRQRIGIARALYHNPEVLVLDEATSSLDTSTERGVMRAVNALRGDRTVLIVAHRLSTVEKCDRLYRLEHGKVVAEGTPAEVLRMAHAV
jgi:UDP-N-acetyl-D-galactosamine dehydrogenase